MEDTDPSSLLTHGLPFDVFRSDRLGTLGGGAAILVHNSFSPVLICQYSRSNIECIVIDIFPNSLISLLFPTIRFIRCCRSPSSTTDSVIDLTGFLSSD